VTGQASLDGMFQPRYLRQVRPSVHEVFCLTHALTFLPFDGQIGTSLGSSQRTSAFFCTRRRRV
jgi:hypothetical protein